MSIMDMVYEFFQVNDGSLYSGQDDGGVLMWNPLLLVIVILVVLLLTWLFGKIFFREDYNKETGQVKPFYSGNLDEINYNVQSENLYWGITKALQSYYNVLRNMHTGDLTDYIKWLIITMSVVLLLINGGLL
jgi:hypothetical protein